MPHQKEGVMRTIEIDFDVYKALTLKRETEAVSYNDVLREILGLGPAPIPNANAEAKPGGQPWVSKGVSFPHGTEFRSTYKGREITGVVANGALVVDGKRHNSPSSAAVAVTGTSVNGWLFWECKMPSQSGWRAISGLRKS